MKRNRKGRTRTGAIPTCMAEVSPLDGWRMLMDRRINVAMAESAARLEEIIFGVSVVASDGYDGVQLFTRSHPPLGDAAVLPAHPTPEQSRAFLRSRAPMAKRLFLGEEA